VRGEVRQLLLFLFVVLLAYFRVERERDFLWEEDLGEGLVRVELVSSPQLEENKLRMRVKVVGGDFAELYGRHALLDLYRTLDLPSKVLDIYAKVRVSRGFVILSADYRDVVGLPSEDATIRDRLIQRAKERIEDREVEALTLSYLFGESQEHLPHEEQRSFRTTGLLHILVVSGGHLAVVFLILRWLAPYHYGMLLGLLGTTLYTFLVVPLDPPVLRAYLMLFLFVLVRQLQGLPNMLSILLLSGSFILLIYPDYLYSYSFWLSSMATLYLILSTKDMPKWEHPVNILIVPFWLSLFAFLGTAPIVLSFSTSTPNSIPFTPVVSPLFLLFTFYGVLELLSFFSLPTAPMEFLGKLILALVNFFGKFEWELTKGMSNWEVALLCLLNAVYLYFAPGFWKMGAFAVFLLFYWT
jgi:competence protein ComEC